MPFFRNVFFGFAFILGSVAFGQVVSEFSLRPVSPRGEGDPMFERMDTERTGIGFENRFDHPRRWLELWKQYFNGSIGTGVALGDVNGDGLPDIFAMGKDSPNGLFLNKGEFRFEDATAEAGVAGGDGFGTGAAFVDIDNDGDLDLYACYVAGTNELWINDGTGRFEDRAKLWGLDFEGGANAPSYADYDRDGDLDLYLQQNYLYGAGHLDGMPDLLFRNDDGLFVEVTVEAGISGDGQGHTALWWDFDEDGWLDIYVSNDFEPVDKLYRNNKDGTFSDVLREELGGAPYSAMGVDSGDLNNDGHIDFIAAEMLARDRAYYHQAVGPLSGKLISAKRSGVSQYMQNMLWAATGDGGYVEISRYAGLHATNWTWATRFVDLDNDGLLDAFFANGMTRAFHDGDLAYRMTKARSMSTRVRVFETSPPLEERNLAFRNDGDFRFSDVSEDWGLDAKSVSFAAAFADFDQDGDLDLVTSNWKEGLGVYRNNSQVGNRMLVRLDGSSSNRTGLGARLALHTDRGIQTRELSSMRGYMSVDEAVAHFAAAEGTVVERLLVSWPSGTEQVVEGVEFGKSYSIAETDVGRDYVSAETSPIFRRADIEIDDESVSYEERFAARKGQFLLPISEDRLGPALAVADIDGDGWKDVVLGGATGQALRILLNDSGEALRYQENPKLEYDDLAEDSSILPFKLKGSPYTSLLVTSGGVELDAGDEYYSDRLYAYLGEHRFSSALWRGKPTPTTSSLLVGSDILLLAGGTRRGWYPFSETNRFYRIAENGTFEQEAHDFENSGRTSRLVAADLDGDGDEDVIQLREYATPLAWRYEAGDLVEWPEVFSGLGKGLWKSAAVADFDGDGRMDIALGNLGENNKYSVSYDTPAALYAPKEDAFRGKFIETETIKGERFPRESRIFHQVDFSDIAERTGGYQDFAKLTVEEIFGEDTLSEYEMFEMTERRTLLLRQKADGGFEAVSLPNLAQAGVAIDMLAEDFDFDSDVDLAVVLESLSPQPAASIHPETSFMLLLRNDGAGGFTAELPNRSGLVFPEGEPRRLVWEDLNGDGRKELVVSTNEGPLYIFETGEPVN